MRWKIFLHSVAFVLGFSLIFSLVGVLLQSVLADVSYNVQRWLGYVGGTVIILFGIYLLGLIKIQFLEKEYKFKINRGFSFKYVRSFVFGAAFAVGWTPCVGAILGGILTLAITNPGSAFGLLVAYSLGLGLPFLVVGLFTDASSKFIQKLGNKLNYFNYFFGVILIILGILIFTNNLNKVASFPLLVDLFSGKQINFSSLGIGISFFGGVVSFLSPCVLPLIPAFLSYLAVSSLEENQVKKRK